MILFYDELNPQSRCCLMLIKTLNLNVEICVADNAQNTSGREPYLAVPTLVEGDLILQTSQTILTFLCDYCCSGVDMAIYPRSLQERFQVNEKLQFENTVLFRQFSEFLKSILENTVNREIIECYEKQVFSAYDVLESFLCQYQFMAASFLTIADLAISATLSTLDYLFPIVQGSIYRWMRLWTWYNSMKSYPCFYINYSGIEKFKNLVQAITTANTRPEINMNMSPAKLNMCLPVCTTRPCSNPTAIETGMFQGCIAQPCFPILPYDPMFVRPSFMPPNCTNSQQICMSNLSQLCWDNTCLKCKNQMGKSNCRKCGGPLGDFYTVIGGNGSSNGSNGMKNKNNVNNDNDNGNNNRNVKGNDNDNDNDNDNNNNNDNDNDSQSSGGKSPYISPSQTQLHRANEDGLSTRSVSSQTHPETKQKVLPLSRKANEDNGVESENGNKKKKAYGDRSSESEYSDKPSCSAQTYQFYFNSTPYNTSEDSDCYDGDEVDNDCNDIPCQYQRYYPCSSEPIDNGMGCLVPPWPDTQCVQYCPNISGANYILRIKETKDACTCRPDWCCCQPKDDKTRTDDKIPNRVTIPMGDTISEDDAKPNEETDNEQVNNSSPAEHNPVDTKEDSQNEDDPPINTETVEKEEELDTI